MNSLLKRQIRKYLHNNIKNQEELAPFLDAINRSYENFNEQFNMLQRATSISSGELFNANSQLKKESSSQKEIIEKLNKVVDALKFYDLENKDAQDNIELDGSKLVDFIENQTKEIIEINKQRDILLNNLEKQNQELGDYAHMVSHDLKSPLRAIESLTTWLKEDYEHIIDLKGKETINHIKNNVEKMDALVNGILEYSTIGKTESDVFNINLNTILNEILETVYCPENIEIKVSNLPTIKGNKHRLKQLFQNIIDNSIKYNDKKQGVIEIGFEDFSTTHWQFHIKDNGKGIDKKYFEKIFMTFKKLENNVDSSGIGLSIVKKIVDLYEGEIWLNSEIDKGTTFYFTLKK